MKYDDLDSFDNMFKFSNVLFLYSSLEHFLTFDYLLLGYIVKWTVPQWKNTHSFRQFGSVMDASVATTKHFTS